MAAAAKESARAQGEAIEAQAEAEQSAAVASSIIGVTNRYFVEREAERRQQQADEQERISREFEASQRALDRASREGIAERGTEARLGGIDKQQEGMNTRLTTLEAGRNERANLSETGRNERFDKGIDFKSEQAKFTESGRQGRHEDTMERKDRSLDISESGLKLRTDAAASKRADEEQQDEFDTQMGDAATRAYATAYEAKGGEIDDWGRMAILHAASGKPIPKWLHERTAAGNTAELVAEKPGDTEQAMLSMVRFSPTTAAVAAGETVEGTDYPTGKAASAFRAFESFAESPATPLRDLKRVHSELRFFNAKQASPAIAEILNILGERIAKEQQQQQVPASPQSQGGGSFWGSSGPSGSSSPRGGNVDAAASLSTGQIAPGGAPADATQADPQEVAIIQGLKAKGASREEMRAAIMQHRSQRAGR